MSLLAPDGTGDHVEQIAVMDGPATAVEPVRRCGPNRRPAQPLTGVWNARPPLAHPLAIRQTHPPVQIYAVRPSALPVAGKGQTGIVFLRRSGAIPPLPWSTFSPPSTTRREDGKRAVTIGADKAYYTADFVETCAAFRVEPHVRRNTSVRRANIADKLAAMAPDRPTCASEPATHCRMTMQTTTSGIHSNG